MTMTMPAVEQTVDTLKALDFDVLCDVKECEHAADWWNVCLECGAHTPVCEPHRRVQVLWAESSSRAEYVICAECSQGVQARAWRRMFSFVPIGRS